MQTFRIEPMTSVHAAVLRSTRPGLLLDAQIASTDAAEIRTIPSGIFPENTASHALHQAARFRVVGTGNAPASTTAAGAMSS